MSKEIKKVVSINQSEKSNKASVDSNKQKTIETENLKKKKQEIKSQNKAFIKSALDIAKRTKSKTLFIYVDAVDDSLINDKLPDDIEVVLVTKNPDYSYSGDCPRIKDTIKLPRLKLGRMGIIKITILFSLSAKLVEPNDSIVFLVGRADVPVADTVINLSINEESELLSGHSISEIPMNIDSAVFEQTLNLAIELGSKGKEGKPIGTIFVLGDDERVMQLSKQMIINPFKGYSPDERNILNPMLKETMREFSSLDGAFVLSGNGEVITAGRYLGAATEDSDIPRGLGSRHIAASGITALTNAVAIVISESTGDVRIFKSGKVIMTLDKPNHK
jgi:diadenylate cyclase